MPYHKVQAKTDVLRHFRITCGLRSGYGSDCKEHSTETAMLTIHRWMRHRCNEGLQYVTGIVTSGYVLYTWPGAKGDDKPEPAAVFSGDISVVYNADLEDNQVVEILNDLASYLGKYMNQTRVYVAYRKKTWIMEAGGKTSPRATAI